MRWTHTRSILLSLGLLVAVGCAHPFPESSLTGVISEVKVGDGALTPKEITVNQGDEVRWMNLTKGIIDVAFMQSLTGIVSCDKGFEETGKFVFGSAGGDLLFNARVDSNRYASLCFSLPGTYGYAVEMDEATTGKATRMHGTLRVE